MYKIFATLIWTFVITVVLFILSLYFAPGKDEVFPTEADYFAQVEVKPLNIKELGNINR
ncbi:hypothetical protein HY419_01950 [candidate division WWE3 bacterium]|nr:hypothetical protein [candidate division WWE3 bacterium]